MKYSDKEVKEILKKFASYIDDDKVQSPSMYRRISDSWFDLNVNSNVSEGNLKAKEVTDQEIKKALIIIKNNYEFAYHTGKQSDIDKAEQTNFELIIKLLGPEVSTQKECS